MTNNILYAIVLTLLAGLATGVGGLISIILGKTGTKYLSIILGFSAGVMIYVSFAELFPVAIAQAGALIANIAFFGGIIFLGILDILVPHEYKGEHVIKSERAGGGQHGFGYGRRKRTILMRAGLFTALGIAIHNVPEGLAVFTSALSGNIQLGIVVAVAVALHNIPEGISVASPILEATRNRKRAFLMSLYSGLAEPAGAVLGFLVLFPFISPILISSLLAFAAGIMVYISLDELLPAAHQYGESHWIIIGVGLGMMVMAASALLLK